MLVEANCVVVDTEGREDDAIVEGVEGVTSGFVDLMIVVGCVLV